MTDLESRLAEAREGIMPNDVSEMAASHRRAFDAAANIAREVVAEKDAEIVRLKAAKLRALNVADRLYEQAAKFKAEADKAKADMFDVAWRADELIDDAVAQTRKVTDAQRIVDYLESDAFADALDEAYTRGLHTKDNGSTKSVRILDEIIDTVRRGIDSVIESTDEPAAK